MTNDESRAVVITGKQSGSVQGRNVTDAIGCNVYPMTQVEDMALDDWLDEQLAKGYIRPSISPYASSFFFIKKKDGKLRPVQDYRNINKWTVRNQYPLPLITSLI